MDRGLDGVDTPLPSLDDHDLKPYWQATAAHELRVQQCVACKELRWPPRGACGTCQSLDSDWVVVPQTGELFTWTVVHQTGVPGFADLVPYAVGVVQLDDVPIRMLGYLTADPATLEAGERLRAKFVPRGESVVLPIWERAA